MGKIDLNSKSLLLAAFSQTYFSVRLGKCWHTETCKIRTINGPCECGFSQLELAYKKVGILKRNQ
jgi:hypothetical protein